MSSTTTWLRLEPYARSAALEGGLNAAIHDPLWLLARQWQLGEFQGEDVGSPVHTQLEMICTPVTRYLPGGVPKDGYPLDAPLETLIERESIRMDRTSNLPNRGDEGALQPRLSAEAGLHFWRLLYPEEEPEHIRSSFLENFALKAPSDELKLSLDADTRRFLLVTVDRVPDGELLFYVLRAVNDPATLNTLANSYKTRVTKGADAWLKWKEELMSRPDHPDIDVAVTKWLAWYEKDLFSVPSASNSSWDPERMEYAALVAAPAPTGEMVLSAPEYTDGHLDWYSFNVSGGSLGAQPREPTPDERIQRSAIPVPVTFRGMPASRYWEFEDARIDFGSVTAGPQQLARLLLIEFGLIAGDDWFIIPVVVPVGSLCQTNSLVVSDTFGERTRILSAHAVDTDLFGVDKTDLPWDMFHLSYKRHPGADRVRTLEDVLFLPPVLGTSLNGAPLEEVMFLRDEMANMAWAVERIVENPMGRPIDRSETFFRSREKKVPTGATPGQQPLYLLAKDQDIPEHWVPLLPVPITNESTAMWLQRELMGKGRLQGLILEPDSKSLHIYEEEVPREGARVTRAFQYARWIDGKTYLWVGRRKGVGRGEGSSGLQFDVLEPPRE